MNRTVKIALALLLMMPCILNAAPRMGAGARADMVSSGFEFRFWFPAESGTRGFVAPQAIGFYAGSTTDAYYFYNVGLRGGVMFRSENWISPIADVSVGYGDYDSENRHLGARAAIGISVAPFQYSPESTIGFLKKLAGLRFEFDSGLIFRRDNSSYSNGTFESLYTDILLPDFGAGFVFNW
ncbi:hypothetical protein GF359_10570 [candidate division WOR-3 bacterium]|uniref:Outer membrane protein beta-barrel domain-containing protein n=1 Tax=candidate division WOR-3 bacterium TaxID=2052148 RepID=A0A9D5KBE9_UNCW3|nr:hypothetical protein [candidate division WOR-3 bacterium]MBD3365645.1 hypothetical protein [candidate division WOR-3 bacterium]